MTNPDALDGTRHFDGPILLPYQAAWNQDQAPLAVCEKGRRVGLSWGEAAEDALLASTSATDGGMDVWYLSYNKEMTETFIKDVAFWAKIYNLAAGDIEEAEEIFQDGDERKAITVFRVRFASGHKVTGLVSHPRVLRSKQGKVVIDEAAFVDDLDELLKAALAMLVWGGCVRVISTHNGEDNRFNELINDIRAGKLKGAVVHRIEFKEAVRQGLFKRICAKKGATWTPEGEASFIEEIYELYRDNSDEELDCVPKTNTGGWLTGALISSCMSADIPVLRWVPPAEDFVDWPVEDAESEVADWCEEYLLPLLEALPAKSRHYLGEDFGRSGDLTCLVPLTEMPSLELAAPFVLELRNAPYRTQTQIIHYILDKLPRFSGAAFDARGNGQAVAEAARQRYGPALIAEVMLTDGWYREHMPKTKTRFEDRTLLLPKDTQIRDDLRAVKMINGVARLPQQKTNVTGAAQRHGDAAIAIALGVFAAETIEAGEFSVKSSGANARTSRAILEGYNEF
ncbi:MAG: hypothetical protein KKE73_09685 [Proteobacteria bacterium]|nr:hypothetical protein [Pseudomonadota bacterium]